MTTRNNGFGGGEAEYETGPFRLDALSEQSVLREQPRFTPFGDLESPFGEREDEAEDEDTAYEASELDDHEDVCPHCGRELEDELDEAPMMSTRSLDETPFLEEASDDETPFEAAEVFDEYEGYSEIDEEEELDVEHLFEAEAEFASLSPSELKAIRITSTFETGRAGGFGGLTGNSDGQGLSFGLMNWTIKAGGLIPMLQEFITKHADRYAKIFGSDAERFKAMVFATRPDPKTGRQVRDVSAQMDFVRGKMNNAAQTDIVEPWVTYFKGLENDPEFRAIEIAAVHRGMGHAKRWFHRFGWKSERGFVFMFDLVSSAGPWWLDAKKFHGKREKLLAERTAAKKAELGRELTELEMMELLANLIADVSSKTYRDKVRTRKLWFVHGKGKVHKTFHDLTKEFGVTDAPADFGAGSPSGSASASHAITDLVDVFGDAAKQLGKAVKTTDEAAAVYVAIQKGETDPAKLTNLIFHARHPELGGRSIKKSEHALADEWNEILRTIVRPVLAKAKPAAASSSGSAPATVVSGTTEVLGIDTSVSPSKHPKFEHDWAKAKSQGIAFAIPRAHTGWTADPAFPKDWPALKAEGIVRGGYLFLVFPHPKHKGHAPSPEVQAKRMIKTMDAAGLEESDFPPVLDVEFPGGAEVTGMTHKQLLAGVREAWKVLKDHYGVAPMIYTSNHVWRDDLGNLAAPDLVESPLWVTPYYYDPRHKQKKHSLAKEWLDPKRVAAGKNKGRHDPPVPKPWGDQTNWWIHQFQGDCIGMDGFSSDVDLNRFHVMMPGESGDRVKWVQRRLGISETGAFDTTMEKALKLFQTSKGLITETGLIGPATFARLCWVRI